MSIPVLIVDDNPGNLRLTSYLLEREGFDVRTAASAKDALAVLADFAPRLILMDLQLPDVDGLTLTRQLKADPSLRGVQIIALTAFAMRGDEERALAAGCDAYVTKPIDTRSFSAFLRRHLGA